MAKKELAGSEGDPAAKLKKELKRLVTVILDEEKDDVSSNAIDRAEQVLCALRDLKAHKTASFTLVDVSLSCPDEFRCPLSKQLMKDPVIVATGQTYERLFIEKWLNSGQRTCPRTLQVLSHALITPNHLIRNMISKWCRNRGFQLPDHQSQSISDEDCLILEDDRDRFFALLDKISSSSTSDQKSAAKELRLLTKQMPSFRALFGESADSIPRLLKPLTNLSQPHPDLQEDLITTLLNLSIHDSNKKLVAETPMVLPILIESLKTGTSQSRSNAAAALFTLSALDSNKSLIGRSGALGPLITLLNDPENHPSVLKDAASAIFSLCILLENKVRAIKHGAVRAALGRIKSGTHVDELLAILAMLASHERAIEELGELGAVPCLLEILRDSTSAKNKENCVAVLYAVCMNSRTRMRAMREEEGAFGTLSKLARNGTSRAKRKASGILERLNRSVDVTQTA